MLDRVADRYMTQPLIENSSTAKKYIFALWFVFLTALAGVGAYYRMFTEFSAYDDEGALMVSVKQYLGGLKLYKQIVVPYGPVYYFYNWTVRTLSRTPVTHDVVRMSSLIPWLLTALVAALIVYRITGSLALASVTHLLTSLTLARFFQSEPGHPQELCILLLVCLAASGIVASIPRWRLLGMILLGALTTALLLVKVNIGTFAFLAVSLAILAHAPKTRLSRLAFYAAAAASVILPIVLMKSHLGDEPTRMYAVLVVLSMFAALLVLFRVPRTSSFQLRECWIALGSFAITFAGVILALKMDGVGPNAMLHALVLDSFTSYVNQGAWYLPLPADQGWLPWIVAGLAAVVFLSRNGAKKERTEDELHYLKLAVTIFAVAAFFLGMPLFKLVLPFCWLVLYGRPGNGGDQQTFPRTLLCLVAVLQTLYAYPVAGSQRSFILVLPIIVVIICLGDLSLWQHKRLSVVSPLLIRTATSVLLLCVVISYLVIAGNERQDYDSLPSLQLPGAGRIHLQPSQARDYRWLVQNLDDHCDIFMGLPELPSLHIWTGKDPLRGLEMDAWILTASNEQQAAASVALSEHPDACAIYNPALTNFWNRTKLNLASFPVVRYLRENFKVAGSSGQFYLLVRNERDLKITSPR